MPEIFRLRDLRDLRDTRPRQELTGQDLTAARQARRKGQCGRRSGPGAGGRQPKASGRESPRGFVPW